MSGITLRRLEAFAAVVETGSFANAAQRLGISQPSISAHIKALEEDARGSLFERQPGRRVQLTPLGAAFRSYADRMLAEAHDMRISLDGKRRAARRSVIFACQTEAIDFLMSSGLAEFAASLEDHELVLRTGGLEVVVALLRAGAADAGYVLSHAEPPGVASAVIGSQNFFFLAAAAHPLASRQSIATADIRRQPFVGPSATSAFGHDLYSMLASIGVTDLDLVASAARWPALRELVLAGVGITCAPENVARRDLEAGTLAALNVDAPHLQMKILRLLPRGTRRTPSLGPLADFIRARAGAGV